MSEHEMDFHIILTEEASYRLFAELVAAEFKGRETVTVSISPDEIEGTTA